MKTINIKDFSIEITDDILEDFYKDLSNEDMVNKVVDDIRKHKVNFWITLAEKEMMKKFIKRVREEM